MENVQTRHEEPQLPEGCRLVDFHTSVDSRGSLSVAESYKEVPFEIQRVFWITDITPGASRGEHAHLTCSELLVPIAGSFRLWLTDGKNESEILVDNCRQGVLVPAGVWCKLTEFTPGTVCLCMASQPYMPDGYIDDFETYLSLRRHAR